MGNLDTGADGTPAPAVSTPLEAYVISFLFLQTGRASPGPLDLEPQVDKGLFQNILQTIQFTNPI